MLSVECDRDELHAVLDSLNETAACRVDIACYNGSRNFVLAGDTASMAKAEIACQYFKTVRLHNNHAYHSYVADGILSGLNTLAESINIQTPRLHVETCSTGESWSQFTAREVVQHTRQPVHFAEAVERIAARLTSAVWLEAGSTSPIIAMTRRIVRKSDRSDTFIPMDLETADATANLANATSQLWKAGCAAHYWLFHRSSSHHYENLNLPLINLTNHGIDPIQAEDRAATKISDRKAHYQSTQSREPDTRSYQYWGTPFLSGYGQCCLRSCWTRACCCGPEPLSSVHVPRTCYEMCHGNTG